MATKALETLRKAVKLKKNSIQWYAYLQKTVRDEIQAIKDKREYTLHAKEEMIRELKNMRGIEIMQLIDKRKQAYLRLLNQAKKQAEDTIYAKIKKPSDEQVERFNVDVKHVKTKLLLAKTGDEVKNILKSFIEKIEVAGEDRAYFATELANQFAEIVPMALNVDSSKEMKFELDKMYDHLYYDLQTDEVKEAREVLDTANHLLQNPTIFSGPLVEYSANELFGRQFTDYMNRPEDFFAQPQNEQHKRTYSEKELDEYIAGEIGEDESGESIH